MPQNNEYIIPGGQKESVEVEFLAYPSNESEVSADYYEALVRAIHNIGDVLDDIRRQTGAEG